MERGGKCSILRKGKYFEYTFKDRLTKSCLRMFEYHQHRRRRRLVYHLAKLRVEQARENFGESIHASKMLSSKLVWDVKIFYSRVKCQHYAASFVITSFIRCHVKWRGERGNMKVWLNSSILMVLNGSSGSKRKTFPYC